MPQKRPGVVFNLIGSSIESIFKRSGYRFA